VQARRRAALLPLAWVAATAASAAVAWSAVALVGDRTGDLSHRVLSRGAVSSALRAAPAERAGLATALPDVVATTAPPASRPAAVSSSEGPTPPAAPQTRTPAETPRSPAEDDLPRSSAAITRTWRVLGGRASARCSGASITLVYATPEGGWAVQVANRGPEEIEVHFRKFEATSQLGARCTAGRPTATTEGPEHEH